MAITYLGTRTRIGCGVTRRDDDNVITSLPYRLDLFNHSPDGFEWGYGGSGPAQLALALLADATGDDECALAWHQEFKSNVVSHLDHAGWTMTEVYINGWIRDKLGSQRND